MGSLRLKTKARFVSCFNTMLWKSRQKLQPLFKWVANRVGHKPLTVWGTLSCVWAKIKQYSCRADSVSVLECNKRAASWLMATLRDQTIIVSNSTLFTHSISDHSGDNAKIMQAKRWRCVVSRTTCENNTKWFLQRENPMNYASEERSKAISWKGTVWTSLELSWADMGTMIYQHAQTRRPLWLSPRWQRTMMMDHENHGSLSLPQDCVLNAPSDSRDNLLGSAGKLTLGTDPILLCGRHFCALRAPSLFLRDTHQYELFELCWDPNFLNNPISLCSSIQAADSPSRCARCLQRILIQMFEDDDVEMWKVWNTAARARFFADVHFRRGTYRNYTDLATLLGLTFVIFHVLSYPNTHLHRKCSAAWLCSTLIER